MRRFLKPAIVVVAAAGAAFAVAANTSPFSAAPAAESKTIEICEPEQQNPSTIDLPEIEIPEIEIPEIDTPTLPDIPDLAEALDVELPCLNVPDLSGLLDDIELPEVEIPEIDLPEVDLPEIEIPEIEIPEIEIPSIELPIYEETEARVSK